MIDPLFWLGFSILLVAISLAAVLVAALPALQEIARAARSVEKLADTLSRELPPTLQAIRLTGLEISDLTDDVSEGVKSANQTVKQVEQSVISAKTQAKKVQITTRSVFSGVKAAWRTLSGDRSNSLAGKRSNSAPLNSPPKNTLDFHESPVTPSLRPSENNREATNYRKSESSHLNSEVYWPNDDAD